MKRRREEPSTTSTIARAWNLVVNTVTSIFAPELLESTEEAEPVFVEEKRRKAVMDRPAADEWSNKVAWKEEARREPDVVIAEVVAPPLPAPPSSFGVMPSVLDLVEEEQQLDRFEQSVHNLSLTSHAISPPSSPVRRARSPARQQLSPLNQFYVDAEDRSLKLSLLDAADPPDRMAAINRLRQLSEKFHETLDLPQEVIEKHSEWVRSQEAASAAAVRELTAEEERLYEETVEASGREGDVVTQPQVEETYDVKLTKGDIWRMLPGKWLNDETINLYFKMIQRRAKDSPELPQVHCFNSFFYSMFLEHGFKKVQRWTRRTDLFAKALVLFPVHLGNHWCLGIINFAEKRLQYFDSLRGANPECVAAMREYVEAESLDKKKVAFDWSGWQEPMMNHPDLPQQTNGSDCGVFACMFAEYVSRGQFPSFRQGDMPNLRKRMVVELVTGSFLQ